MEEFNWIDMLEKMQDIYLFSSLNVRRTKKEGIASSQELNLLSRIVLSEIPLTPMELAVQTGLCKSAISRLIERMEKKAFIKKQYNLKDKRSYTLLGTEKGNKELEQTYRYYLEPIYKLRRTLGEELFESLIAQIKEANNLLQNKEVNK
ncbi:MAG: MarR family transcriptional regulator [Lachnospiraceae bacterium]|nr:MarR family transcriptional regulator [Lachnospiraceae bacterium]